jgi:hypothetical protein
MGIMKLDLNNARQTLNLPRAASSFFLEMRLDLPIFNLFLICSSLHCIWMIRSEHRINEVPFGTYESPRWLEPLYMKFTPISIVSK